MQGFVSFFSNTELMTEYWNGHLCMMGFKARRLVIAGSFVSTGNKGPRSFIFRTGQGLSAAVFIHWIKQPAMLTIIPSVKMSHGSTKWRFQKWAAWPRPRNKDCTTFVITQLQKLLI